MIDKEKLRELCNRFVDVAIDDEDKVITEWLEQNPLVSTETKVVGLTEKQIKRLVAYIDVSSESLYDDIVTFLETQTFAQPEAKEAPVGLSDEQICELADYISDADYEHHFKSKSEVITEFLKTQTFADTYEDKYNDLYEDCQSLIVDKMLVDKELEQLKSQKFTPNWDDAPTDATLCRINRVYENEHGVMLTSKKIFREERPKPTPTVEVGQVWKHKETGFDFVVNVFQEVADCYCVCAYNKPSDDSLQLNWEGNHINFLTKFEQVQQ